MKSTNDLMVSDITILGDFNIRWFMLNLFNANDAEAIFDSAKMVYLKMVSDFIDSGIDTFKDDDFYIESLYFPEYCFEIYVDHYVLTVITPFGKHTKLEIVKKVKSEIII